MARKKYEKTYTGKDNQKYKDLDIRDQQALKNMFNEPSLVVQRPQISLRQYEKKLKWFFDMIDDKRRYGRTSNSVVPGRFYTFKYVPRHRKALPLWDKRPVILCLDNNFTLRFGDRIGQYKGFIGINFHYYPIAQRTKLLKSLILEDPANNRNFINNRKLNIKGKKFDKNRGLQQYHRAGRYPDPEDGNKIVAGAFELEQIPYNFIHDILDFPSVYEAQWANRTPF